MLAAPGATPALGGRGLSPHSSGTGSGRNLPRVSRGDRSVRRRLPALVGRQLVSDPCFILIDDSSNKAPQALGTSARKDEPTSRQEARERRIAEA